MALSAVDVGILVPDDVPAAVRVLARGMRDNPIHVAALGSDASRRERLLELMFKAMWEHMDQSTALGARHNGDVVGVCGRLPPGACRPGPTTALRMLPVFGAGGPATLLRSGRWVNAWGKRDPDERHEHLGPVAVDRHLQGRGIGSAMLAVHARDLDAAGMTGYLETDRAENVRLYERFGYAVVEEAEVLGVANWFMRRPG